MEKNKYDSIFNNGHTPMLIIDSDTGEIRDANLAACSYYGYTMDKLLRMKITDINTLSQQEVFEEMGRARKEDRKFFRFKHKLSNGDVKEVEVYSGPITVDGEPLLFSIIHDVEDKKEMKRKIRLQERYFESLYENSPEAIVMLDNEFRVISINGSFERIFQYSIEEIRHKDITKVICEEKFYDESTYFKDSIERGEFVRKEIQRKRKDGKLVDVSFLGYPIVFDGQQIGVYGVYTDISRIKEDKKEQEKRIQMYINILRSTINSNRDIISVFRPDFSVEFINEAGCRFFNVPTEEYEGMNWNEIIKSVFFDNDYYAVKTIETQRRYTTECRFNDTDQYFRWFCDPIFNEDGELILITECIRDITDEKKYEEQLKSAMLRAEEASKFKTQFIANMTHEIRTPMNGIVGIIELLEETRLSDEQKEYFHMLEYSASRLASIINDVLDISKIEAGKMERRDVIFDINKLLTDVVSYFRIQAGRKGLDLNCSMDAELPDFLIGDPDKINQVLFNLLTNAVKFTEAGQINIILSVVSKDIDHVCIKFQVSDTGIGIPEEKTIEVFEAFYQSENVKNRKYGGAGLGLSISKKLVQLMGGDISVKSKYGKGCTFYFTIEFPIAVKGKTLEKSFEDCRKNNLRMLSALNILVVEDEGINQKIIKSQLERNNCHVTIAANGKKALEILEKQLFDIILMDIYMPVMNGYDTTRLIRQREALNGRYTPIVALTAALQYEDREKFMSLGIDDYIIKPCGRDQISNVIAGVLKKRYKAQAFNLEPLIDRLEGDYELLNDIIGEVISCEYEEDFLGGIENCIREKDLEKLSSHIHRYKGSISHFQSDSIDGVLSEIKEKCIAKDLPEIEKLYGKLKQEYKRLKEGLLSCDLGKK